MLSSLAPARRRLVLGVVALFTAAVVTVGIVVVVSAVRGDDVPAAVPQGTPGPVVLVPGYGGSTTAVGRLAQLLRENGRTASVLDLPGDGRGDLDDQAEALGRFVRTVLDRSRARSVDVVGYSAGGVVARLWVARHGGDRLARRVLTLGSPHHGTEIATIAGSALPSACPTACQQLAATSAVLADLNRGDETPPGPTFVSVWTRRDEVVVPPDSARLDGARNIVVQDVCPGSTVRHDGLPTDPQVVAIVRAELASGPPPALTSADCGRPAA